MPESIRSTLLPIVIGAACVMLAALLFIDQRQAASAHRASSALYRGDYGRAVSEAAKVTRAPSKAPALLAAAVALTRLDRPAEASRLYSLAVHRDPNSWLLRRNWAIVLLAQGQRTEAVRQMRRAVQLNPRLTLPPTFRRTK